MLDTIGREPGTGGLITPGEKSTYAQRRGGAHDGTSPLAADVGDHHHHSIGGGQDEEREVRVGQSK
jgi:hypothetical protein